MLCGSLDVRLRQGCRRLHGKGHGVSERENPGYADAVGCSGASHSFDMLREQVVDERLVAQASPLGFPPHGGENVRIDPNRDQSPGLGAQRRPSYPSHGSELRGRGLRNLGEVNPATPPRRPRDLCGSPGAR